MNKAAVSVLICISCGGAPKSPENATAPAASASSEVGSSSSGDTKPAASGAGKVDAGIGPSRTYCLWVDSATPRAVSTVVALGYPEPFTLTETRVRELTTAPRNRVALRVELVNLRGKTQINLSAVPATAPIAQMASEFFSAYEAGMRPGELCK